VFDFGTLGADKEALYIESMVGKVFDGTAATIPERRIISALITASQVS
jgi:hypothetical protein